MDEIKDPISTYSLAQTHPALPMFLEVHTDCCIWIEDAVLARSKGKLAEKRHHSNSQFTLTR
jgi:hypothetical protein